MFCFSITEATLVAFPPTKSTIENIYKFFTVLRITSLEVTNLYPNSFIFLVEYLYIGTSPTHPILDF